MARERLVWAIDCDDVLVPTAEHILDGYNRTYGTKVTLDDYYVINTDAWGVDTDEEAIRRVHRLLKSGVTRQAVPNQDTIEAVMRLASMDELHLVTGRSSFLEDETHALLDTYFSGAFSSVEHTNYIDTSDSGAPRRSKGEVCRAVNADILVDDHIVHGASVLESGLKEVIVWGDYPWNRAESLEQGMVRCVTWCEVFRERERILANR